MGINALLNYSRNHNGKAIVVMRDGAVLGEQYQNGHPYGLYWPIYSASKTFSALIATQLVAQGRIPSLDAKLSSVITEWQTDPLKEPMTVRQLLSLRSGLKAIEGFEAPPDYADAVVVPVLAEKSGVFQYDVVPFCVWGEFVNRLVRPAFINPAHYLQTQILDPAAITIEFWNFINGNPIQPSLGGYGGGARMVIREFAKLGELLRREGRATSGAQIIPASLVRELRQTVPGYWAYRINLWMTSDTIANAVAGIADPAKVIPASGYAAIGGGNQLLYVLPDANTVIARVGDTDETFNEEEFLDLAMRV